MIYVIIVLCTFYRICLELSRGAIECTCTQNMPSRTEYIQQMKLYESDLVFNSAAHGGWQKCVKGL